MTLSHTITVDLELDEPYTDPETGEVWEAYKPTDSVRCSCGAAWKGPAPEDHDFSRLAREGKGTK